MTLLSVSEDYKTVKGEKLGYLTGILYMLPNTQVCPNSGNAGCRQACLVSAGRGVFSNVQKGRERKTALYKADKQAFMLALYRDIVKLQKKAEKRGLTPVVRLNGTSDVAYENIHFKIADKAGIYTNYTSIFAAFPNLIFYDYTKLPTRINSKAFKALSNYHLTVSGSLEASYLPTMIKAFDSGANIALVFRSKNLPANFTLVINGRKETRQVINGDINDLRFLDSEESDKPVFVGLSAKGKAKKSDSAFIIG